VNVVDVVAGVTGLTAGTAADKLNKQTCEQIPVQIRRHFTLPLQSQKIIANTMLGGG
jgi:hypothetical protein